MELLRRNRDMMFNEVNPIPVSLYVFLLYTSKFWFCIVFFLLMRQRMRK